MEYGGLPYDDSVPATAPPPAEAAPDADGDHPMLDRPLDDYHVPGAERGERGPAPGPVPEHVQGLLGRMGRGKVYLAEESPGILHHDGEARIRTNPRLAKLARELDKQDPTQWLEAISETAPSPIRPTALYVSSDLIKHLSTAKVFTWSSELGAGVMGIEWLNDSTLILLFPTAPAALLGLSLLAKAGFDPTEGDDPLEERAAYGFPRSLLPLASPSPEPEAPSKSGEELMADDTAERTRSASPPVRRKGRGAFREPEVSAHGAFDLAPLAGSRATRFAEGVDPNARVTIRYAMSGDNERRKDAKSSEWYQRHGRGAGKEVGPRRSYGRHDDRLELKDRLGGAGEGRELGRRLGRERRDRRDDPYARDRPERRVRRTAEDLDAELERMATGRAAGDEDMYRGEGEYRDRRERGDRGARDRRERGQPRERRGKDDLDKELDDMFAARPAE